MELVDYIPFIIGFGTMYLLHTITNWVDRLVIVAIVLCLYKVVTLTLIIGNLP